jgi:hypothetical protein
MNKEEYLEQLDKGIDEMSLEKLRAYTKTIWRNSQNYFHNWMKTEEEKSALEIKLFLAESKLKEKKKDSHQEYLEEFKKYAKNITSSKKKSRKFLMQVGINDKNGKLTKEYGG